MSTNVANTIWNQIITGGTIKVMSWGVPMKSRAGQDNEDGSGFLRFKVNGMKFKGFVKVIYRRIPDDYKIEFIKVTKFKNDFGLFEEKATIEKEIEGVYCDQLTEIIDDYVERIPAYKH